MPTAYQKVRNIMERNKIIHSQNQEEIKNSLEQIKNEASSSSPFDFVGDDVINGGYEKLTRWLDAFFNDDIWLLKIYNKYVTTDNLFCGNDYFNPTGILPHIVMSIISHQHTDTIKFVISECTVFRQMNIRPIYLAALYSENIPIIKSLVEKFPNVVDIYMIYELIQRNKFEVLDVLFSDEQHIRDNGIISDIINYALSSSNIRVLDFIGLLAKKYMPDYLEFDSPELAESVFVHRNINSAELLSGIYDTIFNLLISNKDICTAVLDYLVDMNITSIDASKMIRLCAAIRQRYNTFIDSDKLIEYTIKFIAPDAYISCSYMVDYHSYSTNINNELKYILKSLYDKKKIKLRLTLNDFNPESIYEFKVSELRILLKYCIPEKVNNVSENSLLSLLIEKDKYTILEDIIKGYDFTNSEIEHMIEKCVNLKKMKSLNVLRKYYQQ